MDAAKNDVGGVGAGAAPPTIWDDARHIRGNARTILHLLKLGDVFSDMETRAMLRGALPVILNSITNKKGREYAAVMKILLECVKIENGLAGKQGAGDINILVENGNVTLSHSERVVRIASLLAGGGTIETPIEHDAQPAEGTGPPPALNQSSEMGPAPRSADGRLPQPGG